MRWGRPVRRLALLLALLGLLSACDLGEAAAEGPRAYYLQRVPEGGDRLVGDTVSYPVEAGAAERFALLEAALRSPRREGYLPALSEGVEVGFELRGTVAYVELGGTYGSLSEGRRSLISAAVSLSLLEMGGINFIYIRSEGEGQPPLYDRPISSGSFITPQDAERYFSN